MREFPHARVCEGWGRQRPHLLGDDPTSARLAVAAEKSHPLPFAETGDRSHVVADVEAEGRPVGYVLAWLEHAARSPHWRARPAAAEPLSLF